MSTKVREHYEKHPYPSYPLIASVRRYDTCHLNLESLWGRFNGKLPDQKIKKILIAGCGSFAPYPFAVANPDAEITALDISNKSLNRAKAHCLLHGHFSVRFCRGDLIDATVCNSTFDMLDAFGILHHLEEPLAGLKALAERTAENGIVRVMVYSRYARRDEESIRRALKLLGVESVKKVRDMIARSGAGSRLRSYAGSTCETRFSSGIADALLHPCVKSFRIDELMDIVSASGLTPLSFAHEGALDSIEQEVKRIREMERKHLSPGNFILYLGKNCYGECIGEEKSMIKLNQCLDGFLGNFRFRPLQIGLHSGRGKKVLDRRARKFLRRFAKPNRWSDLDENEKLVVEQQIKSMLLIRYRDRTP